MALAVVCWGWFPLADKADCASLFPGDAGSLKLAVVGVFRRWKLENFTHQIFFSGEAVYQHTITAADGWLGGLLKVFLSNPLFIARDSAVRVQCIELWYSECPWPEFYWRQIAE